MKNKNTRDYTIKLENGKFVYGRLLTNAIIEAVSTGKSTLDYDGRDLTILSDEIVEDKRIVTVRVEDA